MVLGAVQILTLNASGTVLAGIQITQGVEGFSGALGLADAFGTSVAASETSMTTASEIWPSAHRARTGGLVGPLSAFDNFGSSLACAGDLGQDSVPDLAVGAPGQAPTSQAGALWLLNLTPAGNRQV